MNIMTINWYVEIMMKIKSIKTVNNSAVSNLLLIYFASRKDS